MKINLAHTVAFQQMKCKCQSHRGDLSSDIVFSHDTCHAAEQDKSDSKVSFVRRPQQAKLGVFCPGPEGRNTAHLSALNGRCKERENLASPCCSFGPHAMKTSVWMMNFALFPTFVTLPSILRVIPFDCWQLWRRAPLGFRDLEK